VAGGVESLDEPLQAELKSVRDVQLDRAQDLLKSMILYKQRAEKLNLPTQVAAKNK
jgi:hypothetical protein